MPFRTLTGRQHFYVDHEMMIEFGEAMPVYKPTLSPMVFAGKEEKPRTDRQRSRSQVSNAAWQMEYP